MGDILQAAQLKEAKDGRDAFQKVYDLSRMHGFTFDDARDLLVVSENQIRWRFNSDSDILIDSLSNQSRVHFDFIRLQKQDLLLEGRLLTVMPIDKLRVEVEFAEKTEPARLFFRRDRAHCSLSGSCYAYDVGFEIRVPLGDFSLVLYLGGNRVVPALEAGKFCPLSFRKLGYAVIDGHMLSTRPRSAGSIKARSTNALSWLVREIAYSGSYCVKHPASFKLIPRRLIGLFGGRVGERRIWLISDRPHLAGDNGEALFAFLQEHPIPNVTPYFVIEKDSCDYQRLREMGRVVAFGSLEHIRLHSKAELILSSAADDFVFDRFDGCRVLEKGTHEPRFVFLQHGVIKDDMSEWLNRYNKNISLFITSGQRERQSILRNGAYGYNDGQVVLTGLPRHDKLLEESACRAHPGTRKVLIAPTWRSNLAGSIIKHSGRREENPAFHATDYYRFYNSLLNSESLKSCARRLGYIVRFLIHPAFMQEAHKFTSDFVDISTVYDYKQELLTSDVLVTDFSSIAFDFALLKKPVLYTQFDEDSFFELHAWKRGYFDYRADGFGDVCTTLEESVTSIEKLMENPTMEDRYLKRVEDFFFVPAESRCAAVVEAILSMETTA